jgi:CSLREA domain-containing protein
MRGLGSLLAALLWLVAATPSAVAAVITVTATADELTANGNCSLREAIRSANLDIAVDGCTAGNGADEIVLPAGTYTLTIPATTATENAALNGDLDITGVLTITGAGAATTIVEGCAVVAPATTCTAVDRVFDIRPGASVTISGVTVRHGTAFQNGAGGGFLNEGTLRLVDSVIQDNASGASGGGLRNAATATATLTRTTVTRNRAPIGGGIDNFGTLTLVTSRVSDNDALTGAGTGGGIANPTSAGTIAITDSTITGNDASASGGGIFNQLGVVTIAGSTIDHNTALAGGGLFNAGRATLTNSTVSGNSATNGGGIQVSGSTASTVTLVNTTVTRNTVEGEGGGLRITAGVANLKHTILAGNVDTSTVTGVRPDCAAAVTSQGHNLIGDGTGCTGVVHGVNGDQVGTGASPIDPQLSPLADHGGPTLTHGLVIGGPAIDAGNPPGCTDSAGAPLTTDQRGAPRPDGSACDIGAFEGSVARALGHFLCYKAKTTRGTPRFAGIVGVDLVDAFESGQFDLKKTANLCTPADKNGEGITDSTTHLKAYKLALTATEPPQPRHLRRLGLAVSNQLGLLTLDTTKAVGLLVPAAKGVTGPVDPPDPDTHSVDHYKCYKVKVSRGTPKFAKQSVTVADQFTLGKPVELKKPGELCMAVDKAGEGIKNPAAHLLCYKGKAAGTPTPVSGLHVSDQFGAERLDAVKEASLCVPSTLSSPASAVSALFDSDDEPDDDEDDPDGDEDEVE